MTIKDGASLFLDRDGVINRRIPGAYVKNWEDFQFLPGVLDCFTKLNRCFSHIIIVTNQQGIGKGLMTVEDLALIHQRMIEHIQAVGGAIHGVYFCPDLATHPDHCRKPNPHMGLQAKADFPDIDFNNAVMVGDSISDIAFGKNLGMQTVLVSGKDEAAAKLEQQPEINQLIDQKVNSLSDWANSLKHHSI